MVLSQLQPSFGDLLAKTWFSAGYVAGARAHGQPVVALRPGIYPNGTIGAVTSQVGRNVSDRVLMANVPGDALADGHYFTESVGKKGYAARRLCQALEHTRVPVRIVFVEYTYGVDDGGQEAKERVAGEINSILEQMVSLANTKHLGQYIFGGSNTSVPPYVVQRSDGEIASVTYQGGLQDRDIETAPGLQSSILYAGESMFRSDNRGEPVFGGNTGVAAGAGTSSVRGDVWLTVTDDGSGSYNLSIDDGVTTVNVAAAADITNIAVTNSAGQVLYVDATNITGPGVEMVRVTGTYDIFNVLINIRDLLNNQRDLPATTAVDLIDKSAESLDEIKNILIDKQVVIGTKINFLNTLKDSLENIKFNAEDQATLIQEADIAQVAIDISRRETLYQMSLSVAARLMSMSILDFI